MPLLMSAVVERCCFSWIWTGFPSGRRRWGVSGLPLLVANYPHEFHLYPPSPPVFLETCFHVPTVGSCVCLKRLPSVLIVGNPSAELRIFDLVPALGSGIWDLGFGLVERFGLTHGNELVWQTVWLWLSALVAFLVSVSLDFCFRCVFFPTKSLDRGSDRVMVAVKSLLLCCTDILMIFDLVHLYKLYLKG